MKTVNIKGKEYVEVNERIKHFRTNYKEWSISTNLEDLSEKRCVIKATVCDENDRVRSTGIAYEIEGSSFINNTSFIENCETSAIGRALGNLGIGIDTSVASYDEVANAIKQQNTKKVLSSDKFNAMLKAINEGKSNIVKSKITDYILSEQQQKVLNASLGQKDMTYKPSINN